MNMGDGSVALLTGAGFVGVEVSHAGSLPMAHAIGSATAAAAINNSVKESGQPIGDVMETLRPLVERIAAEHPVYYNWWRETAPTMDPDRMLDDSFRFGLERLLDGLELWLKNRPAGDRP
jgi:hypothetical protein